MMGVVGVTGVIAKKKRRVGEGGQKQKNSRDGGLEGTKKNVSHHQGKTGNGPGGQKEIS